MKRDNIGKTVGLFIIVGFIAYGYMTLTLGKVSFLTSGSTYTIDAQFDNVSGIKQGSAAQVAGVVVGEVSKMWLGNRGYAHLALRINKTLKVPIDTVASVKSQGIIGDKFIQLNLGKDKKVFTAGGVIHDTKSAVDIESLISRIAFGRAK